MDKLESMSVTAVYPNGTSQPSVSGKPIIIAQGWPPARDIDLFVTKQQNTLVSIYAEPSSTSPTLTGINTSYVAKAAAPGTTMLVADPTITLGGVPKVGDVVVVIVNGIPFSYAVLATDTIATILAALKALILPSFPDVSISPVQETLTVQSSRVVTGGVSGNGLIANKLHTQRVQFQICVWAATASDRSAVARVIDVALKSNVRIPLADTTSMLLSYQGTNLRDKEENEGVFRRDILFNVTYDTIELVQAQTVVAPIVATSLTGVPLS